MATSALVHSGVTVDTIGAYSVIDCRLCGFRHVMPLPPRALLQQLYLDTYYTEDKPRYIEEYAEDAAWWDLVYSERLYTLGRSLLYGRSVLDVGSGPGGFLKVAQRHGWHAVGVEPSKAAAAFSQTLSDALVINREFDAVTSADVRAPVDAIHMSEVLEHVLEPRATLRRAASLLREDGLICVVVPNDYNPLQLQLRGHVGNGGRPWWLAPPQHLNYFTPRTLRHLLRDVGFSHIGHTVTFPMELFLLMGDDYIDSPETGRRCHAKRKRLELTMEQYGLGGLREQLYQQFAAAEIGRDIVMYGRKETE